MSTNILPNQDELFFQLALSFVPNVGTKTARALLNNYETAKNIFAAPLKELKTVDGVGEFRASMFRGKDVFEQAGKELEFVQRHGVEVFLFNGKGYPEKLLNCDDAPLLLYYKGSIDINEQRTIAVIGTRKNTDYGQRLAEDLIENLAGREKLTVISGLALGIDTIAHKACTKNGIATLGVLGHGLDRIYPSSNRLLAKEMMANGGLLTEFPSGTTPDRQNFPVRNRVVAGMSDVTVVIESDVKGGAMITAYLACSYNREVAAFPGRIYDTKSGGPNLLIKKNIATLITSAEDLLVLMGWNDKGTGKKAVQKELFQQLMPEEQTIFQLLQTTDALHTDDLMHRSGFTYAQLAAILLQLELAGLVKAMPGKMYRTNV